MILAVALLPWLAWPAGFAMFLVLAGCPVPPPPVTDGIVALTGGGERIEAALRLLESGRAGRLLITGIGGGTDLATLARRADIDAARLTDRVSLGRAATSTHGNALETEAWVREHDVGSLIVVTAWYHMPRAALELQRAMPNVALYRWPVWPPAATSAATGTARIAAARRLALEYCKYLAVRAGIGEWLSGWRGPSS